MCYSVMVETDLKRLKREFNADIDLDGLLDLYRRRSAGEDFLELPRGYESFLSSDDSKAAKECVRLAAVYRESELARLAYKRQETLQTIKDLKEKLEKKPLKTAWLALERAERALGKIETKLKYGNSPLTPQDNNIYQYSYAPLLLVENDSRKISFFRYQVKPRWSRQEPDRKINLFNARLDSLTEKRTWAPLWMKRHGALIYRGFYEWVLDPETGKSRVIQFYPEDEQLMWSPALHEECGQIKSFAIITKDPPSEVLSRGHDRCPVFPAWRFLDEWLSPSTANEQQIFSELGKDSETRFAAKWAFR